ncbi:hypothetical protein BDB01DRAFT_807807 [Pilobolus umbonatus]|nr:hypothetical protein BDB01DRAFT_807807 [Pilobolus umbonatus]
MERCFLVQSTFVFIEMTNKKESTLQTAVDNWNHEQRRAIASASYRVLKQSIPLMGKTWCQSWWDKVVGYLRLTHEELADKEAIYPQAIQLLMSKDDRDIRIEILLDMLILSLSPALTTDEPISKDITMLYDARSRRFLVRLTETLGLGFNDLCAVERSVAQQMYYTMLESKENLTSDESNDLMDSSTKTAMDKSTSKHSALKWLATGAGVIGGGALIAITGGLAAPLLAPLLVGITGAGFFASAGGIALMTSVFGLTGGGLTGWKMHRRMKGIDEFEFKQILQHPDLPPVPSLNCTICISGFLLENKDETTTPWEHAFEKSGNNTDIFCLQYDTKELLKLGYSFRRFIKDSAISYAGLEIAKTTVLQAFFAAVALPVTILKMADVIDNPWQIVVDRSKKAGIVLADVLEQRIQGNRPCNLVGYSCGCLVIWYCLLELFERECMGLIDNVVFMGAPISTEEVDEWKDVLHTVSGRFINCYASTDWVLAYVYRLHSLTVNVAGLEAVTVSDRIENIPVDIDGHTKYPQSVMDIMSEINLK